MRLVINRATWLRGQSSYLLRRSDKKMSCLGFLALACGFKRTRITGIVSPADLDFDGFVPWKMEWLLDDDLSESQDCKQAIAINDDTELNDEEIETALSALFARHGIKIEFVYRPLKKRGRKPIDLGSIDVSGVDWSDSDRAIGLKLGKTGPFVKRLRDYHGIPRSQKKGGMPGQGRYKHRLKGKFIREEWATVDWSKPARQIAAEMGVTHQRVYQIKKAAGIPSRQYQTPDWSQVDWSKPLKQIAADLGISKDCVYSKKHKLGLTKPHAKDRIDPSKIDWSRRTVDIAADFGVSRTTIWNIKHKLGLTKPQGSSVPWNTVDWSKSLQAIADELGVSRVHVIKTKMKLGLTRKYNNKPPGRPKGNKNE